MKDHWLKNLQIKKLVVEEAINKEFEIDYFLIKLVEALGRVNLTNFGGDLKPGVKVNFYLLKQRINCWDYCIYFIVPEN